MSIMLQDIGYELVRSFGGKYPSETWEKEFSGGYDKHHLLFDTIHGGAWTVECFWQHFERSDNPNVFIPMGFNPNRDDTAGKGTWHMRDIPALDVRECAAIAEHITALEYERRNGRGLADGGMVPRSYIRPLEEGPICPIPRTSVIFEGQKLTFDDEDSARFAEIVKRHFRKLAGVEVDE